MIGYSTVGLTELAGWRCLAFLFTCVAHLREEAMFVWTKAFIGVSIRVPNLIGMTCVDVL